MMDLQIAITKSELEIMKVLWKSAQPMSIRQIKEILSLEKSWDTSTIKTLVYRLCDKGALKSEKDGVLYYWPLIGEKEYRAQTAKSFIDNLYEGRASNMVATLIADGQLSVEDLDELRAMLREGGKNDCSI